jgi:putative ABC transport system permease protein
VVPRLRRGFAENVRFAMLAVRAHALRSALTVLGVVVGVATVIAIVSIVNGFNNNMVRQFQSFGATLVQFQKYSMRFGPGHRSEEERNRRDLTLEDAVALKSQIPEIGAVSPERYLDTTEVSLKYLNREATMATVAGVLPDYPLANNHFVEFGRFITDADVRQSSRVAVIAPGIRRALFPNESALGKSFKLNGWSYTVVGLLEEKGDVYGSSSNIWLLIPFTTFDHQFPQVKNSHGDTIHIATVPRTPAEVNAVIEKGRALLRARRGVRFDGEDDFFIVTPDRMIRSFQGITRGITGALVFIAFISLLIGGVGIMNIMLVSVTQRTREIGVRKAVGAYRRDIVLQFLIEATTLAMLGGVIGVAVGMAVPAAIKAAFAALPAEATLWSVLAGLSVSMAVGIFFGLYPAVRASRLDPIEALRHE